MLEVTYENFIKLLSENLTIEKIIEKNIEVRKSINKIKSGSKVYIWPSGKMGKRIYKELKNNGYKNLFLVDKNDELQDTISPNKISFGKDDVLIISTITYSKEIYNLAKNMNCKNILMHYNMKELGVISPIVFPREFYDKCYEESSIHLLENVDKYMDMYFSLEDEISRKAFLNNMFFRLTLDIRYTFNCDNGTQYFDDSIVDFNSEDVLIDGGGFNGDTLEEFLSINKPFKSYYLFEPDKDLLGQAKNITSDKRVHFVDKGLFSKKCTLSFNKTMEGDGYITEDGTDRIEAISIDQYIKEKVSFIKMDIEGAELEALKGAENTIKQYLPTLAICIYHKPTDYLDIFNYIKSLNSDYKFYIRHHKDYYADTVLYAVARK